MACCCGAYCQAKSSEKSHAEQQFTIVNQQQQMTQQQQQMQQLQKSMLELTNAQKNNVNAGPTNLPRPSFFGRVSKGFGKNQQNVNPQPLPPQQMPAMPPQTF